MEEVLEDIKYYERHKVKFKHKKYPYIYLNGTTKYVHVIVWEKIHGKKPKGYDIHHKDFDKTNWEEDNLEPLSQSDHQRIHAGWVREGGAWVKKPCCVCKKLFPLKEFLFLKASQSYRGQCKSCKNEWEKAERKKPGKGDKKRQYYREYMRVWRRQQQLTTP